MSHLSFHIQLIFKILWLALAKDQCINGRNNDSHFMKYLYGGTPNTLCQTPGVDSMMYFIIVPRNSLGLCLSILRGQKIWQLL